MPVKAKAQRPIFSAYNEKRGLAGHSKYTTNRYGGSEAVITTYSKSQGKVKPRTYRGPVTSQSVTKVIPATSPQKNAKAESIW